MRTDKEEITVISETSSAAGAERKQPSTMKRFSEVLLRLPKYTALTWALLRDERLDRTRKGVLVAGLGYLAMPFDLVPGIIPVAGQLDDMAVILLALRGVLRSLPADVADDHLRRAGLSVADIDYDLRTLGLTAAWIARKAGSWALRGLGALGDAAIGRFSGAFGRRRRVA